MIDWMNLPALLLSVVILIPAVLNDIRENRIPNLLSLIGFISGIMLHTVLHGWTGAAGALGGGLLLLVVMLPFFALNWMGAGDVKLMSAMGAVSGSVSTALSVMIATVILGALIGVLILIRHRRSKDFTQRATNALVASYFSKQIVFTETNHQYKIPYAVAIAGGTVLVLAFKVFNLI